ncbi:MAG: biotin/lipoyl-binding protein, partial [Verrucomicrobia bacterium]|nr:biotin/lipoyl-binding protein [Verrucomicrobiota bacterium]
MTQTLELDTKTTVPQQTFRPDSRPRRRVGKRALLTFLLAALAIVGSWLALQYYASAISYQSTDDAFIDGHIISVSSKVADRVSAVKFNDNQNVKKGDVLIELDPRDFAAAANQKKAALDSVQAQRGAAQASLQEAVDHVNTLQATVQQDEASANASQAEADRTAADLRRYEDLFKQKVVSIQDLDNARAAARSA